MSLFLLSAVVFLLSRSTGDPRDILLPADAGPREYELAARSLGLDHPLPVQYALFLGSIAQGDLGTSFRARRPVTDVVGSRLGPTLQLASAGMTLALIVGIPLGILGAVRGGSIDLGVRAFLFLGQGMPTFLVGLILINIFAVWLRWLPSGGSGSWAHIILPSATIALAALTGIARLVRSSMLEVLSSQHIQVARSKGLRERDVVVRHALRGALIPVTTYVGLIFGAVFLAGSIVTETIFSWPGLGQLVFQSVLFRDFPVVQALVLLFAATVLLVNLIVDLLYEYLDPRIRHGT